MKNQKWMTFDCYGTLVDWNGGFRGILERIAGDRADELVTAHHHFEAEVELETPHLSYREVLARTLKQAAASCTLELPPGSEYAISDSWSEITPFPDVEIELARMREAGFKLGILTNCDDHLFEQTHAQFARRFDLVITAEQAMDYKPSLSHFRRFQRVSGVEDAYWIHTAYSWFHDMVPASKLGINSIWVDRDQTGHDPSYAKVRIPSASGLCDVAQRLTC